MKYVTLFMVSYIFVFTHIQVLDVEARKICTTVEEYRGKLCGGKNDCLSKSTIKDKVPNLPKPFKCDCYDNRDEIPYAVAIYHQCICSFYC
ncbi:unnamed protein product [Arabidopsis halleri]